MEEANKGMQIMWLSCLLIGALLVIIICIWKLVKIVAMHKMETRIEDLEAISAAQNNGKMSSAAEIGALMSPREARNLRRLSILAGFERKSARSARSSISAGGNSTYSASTGKPFKMPGKSGGGGTSATLPIRRMAEMLTSRRNSGNIQRQPPDLKHATSNGRLTSNFFATAGGVATGSHHRGGFIKDCLSPNGGQPTASSNECSPVLGHKNGKACAIHGGGLRPQTLQQPAKVSQSCQTIHAPPPGFDVEDDDCLSPSSLQNYTPDDQCIESPPSSEQQQWPPRTVAGSDLHHHVHHMHDDVPPGPAPPRPSSRTSTSWMRCINPNHFHHHHHHHDPPTLPITLTHNPIEDTTTAALLFHPPQYQCVICQHNASLYRALSNPSLFTRPHQDSLHKATSLSAASAAKKRDSCEDNLHHDDHDESGECTEEDDDDDQDHPDDELEEEEEEEEEEDCDGELTPPPQLELRRHRMSSSVGSFKDISMAVHLAPHLRDISGLREPLYSGDTLKSSSNSSGVGIVNTASVHWNNSTLEREWWLQEKKSDGRKKILKPPILNNDDVKVAVVRESHKLFFESEGKI